MCMPQPFRRSGHTWLLYLSYAIFGYVLNGLGAVTPFLRAELNLSYTVASLLFSAFATGMIAAGFGGHRLVAHFGRKGLVWFGVFAMCTSELVLMAGRSAWLAIGASFLMGASGSLLASVVPPGLSDEHGESRSIALSELSLIAATSSAAAPLLIGWFSYTVLGWRTGLALPFAAALLLWFGLGRSVEMIESPSASSDQPAQAHSGSLPPHYWIYWVMIIFVVASEFSMVAWSADYLAKIVGLPMASAAHSVSLFLAGMIVGRLTGSRLLLRFSPFQVLTTSLLLAVAGFLLFWSAPPAWAGVVGLFITGAGIACQYPLFQSMALGASGGRTVEASTRAGLASGIAIFLSPLILGRLADTVGIHVAYGIVLVLQLVSLVITQLTNRQSKERRAEGKNTALSKQLRSISKFDRS